MRRSKSKHESPRPSSMWLLSVCSSRPTAQTADTPMGLHNGLETETDGGIHPTVCPKRLFVRRGVGSRSPSMREVFCIMSRVSQILKLADGGQGALRPQKSDERDMA